MKNITFVLLLDLAALASATAADTGPVYLNPNKETGSSQAVVASNEPLAVTAQILPLQGNAIVGKGDLDKQFDAVFSTLGLILKNAGTDFDQVIKLHVCLSSEESVAAIQKALAKRFARSTKPATTFVIGTLAHPDALIAIDAVALAKQEPGAKERGRVKTDYGESYDSSILPAGPSVYVAGQAEKGKDMAEATRNTMVSLGKTLDFLGLKTEDIVQLKCFMNPMSDVGAVSKELSEFFKGPTPPVVYVEWLAGPSSIEIELIASAKRLKDLPDEPVSFLTPPFMQASPVFCRVTRINHGKKIFISGLYGDKATNAEDEVREIFGNLETILKQTDSDLKHLVKATYYVSTEEASKKLNELRPRYYDPKRPPSASKAMVKGVGMAGKSITLDMIAVPNK